MRRPPRLTLGSKGSLRGYYGFTKVDFQEIPMAETMKGYKAGEDPQAVIRRYLQDAIAAEQNFVTVNRAIAKEATMPHVRQLFDEHADETERQEQRLTARLEALGGKPSGVKGFVAHMFGTTPKIAQTGRDDSEKTTQ